MSLPSPTSGVSATPCTSKAPFPRMPVPACRGEGSGGLGSLDPHNPLAAIHGDARAVRDDAGADAGAGNTGHTVLARHHGAVRERPAAVRHDSAEAGKERRPG